MDFVELQEGRKVLELLVPYLEPLTGQRVDDIVRYFGVFGHGQDVVPGTGGGVSYQKHAMPLPL